MMNWRTSRHELKPAASWFEIFDFMNWIARFINAVGNSCTAGAIHGVSQFMPLGQFIVLQEITKNALHTQSIFCKFRPKVDIISWSFESTVWYREYRVNTCDFVRYREYREYRPIKCCTKFAPKSHHIKRPFSSTNWNLMTMLAFYENNLSNNLTI